jgi:hypothetical protein
MSGDDLDPGDAPVFIADEVACKIDGGEVPGTQVAAMPQIKDQGSLMDPCCACRLFFVQTFREPV